MLDMDGGVAGWLARTRRWNEAWRLRASNLTRPNADDVPNRTFPDLIGYWAGPGEPDDLVHPRLFVDPDWDLSERERIAQYLDSGHEVVYFMGWSECRFDCDRFSLGNRELGDGRWAWPEGLSHYVIEHALRLPDEFVEWARTSNYQISVSPDFVAHASGQPLHSRDFWVSWCHKTDHSFDE